MHYLTGLSLQAYVYQILPSARQACRHATYPICIPWKVDMPDKHLGGSKSQDGSGSVVLFISFVQE